MARVRPGRAEADCFYTLDPGTGRHGPPRVPLSGFNHDTEQARASIRKIAALEPAVAWPGHADAVTGDVRAQLERRHPSLAMEAQPPPRRGIARRS